MRRRRSVAFALAASALLLLEAPRARADDLTPSDFVKALESARRAAEDELENARNGNDADWEKLKKASARLQGARVVTPHGPVDADPALDRDVEELEHTESSSLREERLDAVAKRLHGLEREARRAEARAPRRPAESTSPTLPGPTAPGPDANRPSAEKAREALNRVLERPHYRRRTAAEAESSGLAERFESWLQRARNWWDRTFQMPAISPSMPAWLRAILSAFSALIPGTWVGVALWILAIVLVVALLVVRAQRRRLRLAAPEQTTFEDLGTPGERRPVEESYSEAHWRREARLLADHGDFRGAVRALYTGLLLMLQRGGRLKFDKGKTNWEHLRELRRNDKPLATRLEPLTRTFDVVWYGRSTVERGTFDEFLARSDELAQAAEVAPASEAGA